jgi:hypothetical protein
MTISTKAALFYKDNQEILIGITNKAITIDKLTYK